MGAADRLRQVTLLCVVSIVVTSGCSGHGGAEALPAAAAPAEPVSAAHMEAVPGGRSLVLFDDARLTETMRRDGWGFGGPPDPEVPDADWRPIVALPLRNAELRLLSAGGTVLHSETLEKPLVRLAPAGIPTLPPTWAVTEDYGVGMGSYNGPITSFLQLEGTNFVWVTASGAGRAGKLQLMRSLKTEWKLDPTTPGDLLHVACRPDEEGGDFVVTLTRYRYANGGFQAYSETSPGLWEAEDDGSFPPPSAFPQAR